MSLIWLSLLRFARQYDNFMANLADNTIKHIQNASKLEDAMTIGFTFVFWSVAMYLAWYIGCFVILMSVTFMVLCLMRKHEVKQNKLKEVTQ